MLGYRFQLHYGQELAVRLNINWREKLGSLIQWNSKSFPELKYSVSALEKNALMIHFCP